MMRLDGVMLKDDFVCENTKNCVDNVSVSQTKKIGYGMDAYVGSGALSNDYVTYTNGAMVNGMVFNPQDRVYHERVEVLKSYYFGMSSKENVIEMFKKHCFNEYAVMKDKASENESDAEIWKKAIARAYHEYQSETSLSAISVLSYKGRQFCYSTYGGGSHSYIYFDSDNYEKWESMRKELLESANAFAKEITGQKVNYANDYYKDSINWNHDYCELWNRHFGDACERIKISDLKEYNKMLPQNSSILLYGAYMYEGHLMGDTYITIDGNQYVWKQSSEDFYSEEYDNGVKITREKWKMFHYSLLDALDGKKPEDVNSVEKFLKSLGVPIGEKNA